VTDPIRDNPASADVMDPLKELRDIADNWRKAAEFRRFKGKGKGDALAEMQDKHAAQMEALLPALEQRERESFNKGIERAATRLDALGSMAVNTPEQNEILQYAAKNILELRAAINPTEKG
jgi:hypothetical protein